MVRSGAVAPLGCVDDHVRGMQQFRGRLIAAHRDPYRGDPPGGQIVEAWNAATGGHDVTVLAVPPAHSLLSKTGEFFHPDLAVRREWSGYIFDAGGFLSVNAEAAASVR